MNTDFVQLIQVVSSALTPIVVLILGWKINKTLEANRHTLSKDKEWRAEWAKRFYQAVIEYNDSIEDLTLILYFVVQKTQQEKSAGFEEKVKRVQRAEWRLKTVLELAPKSKEKVLNEIAKSFYLLSQLLEKKQGNLDDIREVLVVFNKAAMDAHREIIG